MIFLIISLVAGLIFLISGKVTYRETVYLEGTKARMAGLIFLAPLGLTIAILGMIFILFMFGIDISDSFTETLDAVASTLVRNGCMIGLAYINFHSVSRETKDRSGCLTYWIVYASIIALFIIYFFIPNMGSSSTWFTSAVIGTSILQIISIAGLWSWKKWGVFGYAIVSMISPAIAFLITSSNLQVFISLIQSLALILVLYLLVKPKWQFFT